MVLFNVQIKLHCFGPAICQLLLIACIPPFRRGRWSILWRAPAFLEGTCQCWLCDGGNVGMWVQAERYKVCTNGATMKLALTLSSAHQRWCEMLTCRSDHNQMRSRKTASSTSSRQRLQPSGCVLDPSVLAHWRARQIQPLAVSHRKQTLK